MGSTGRVPPPRIDVEDVSAIPGDDLVRRIDEIAAELAVLQARYRQTLAEAAGWRTQLAGRSDRRRRLRESAPRHA